MIQVQMLLFRQVAAKPNQTQKSHVNMAKPKLKQAKKSGTILHNRIVKFKINQKIKAKAKAKVKEMHKLNPNEKQNHYHVQDKAQMIY